MTDGPTIRCPLCGGPVHEEGARLACEVGHDVDPGALVLTTERHLAEALWMAIEALETEASVLRAVGSDEGGRFADIAADQAQRLRTFASRHASRVNPAR